MFAAAQRFAIYELHKKRLHLLSMAVLPEFRGRGVGRTLVEQLIGKLSLQRNKLSLEVRETNLGAQLFFRRLGFNAISVLRDFYEETSEDAYLMQFEV